ncbi:MAG: ATPase component of Mn/Zn ABC-type transporter [Candidatus Frackibacter sp. T328-2]|nr:MAG: ATPase component of Mn/Zn ABC-type transporter [Candidatus Frackibacter sp. T328-2]
MKMSEIIKIRGLNFGYDEEVILKGVNLDIRNGDFVALVGTNGSGKSTFLKLLTKQISFQQGEIKLFGQNINEFSDWTKLGYISQEVKEFNDSFPATVKEVIGANLYKEFGRFKLLNLRLDQKINKALELVDMLEHKERQIGNLSGGQQQRIFIARALVSEPEVIFLDEPLVGVDIENQNKFYQLLNRLNQDLQLTILIISHDVETVIEYANKVICFSKQKVSSYSIEEFSSEEYLLNSLEASQVVESSLC